MGRGRETGEREGEGRWRRRERGMGEGDEGDEAVSRQTRVSHVTLLCRYVLDQEFLTPHHGSDPREETEKDELQQQPTSS